MHSKKTRRSQRPAHQRHIQKTQIKTSSTKKKTSFGNRSHRQKMFPTRQQTIAEGSGMPLGRQTADTLLMRSVSISLSFLFFRKTPRWEILPSSQATRGGAAAAPWFVMKAIYDGDPPCARSESAPVTSSGDSAASKLKSRSLKAQAVISEVMLEICESPEAMSRSIRGDLRSVRTRFRNTSDRLESICEVFCSRVKKNSGTLESLCTRI